MDRIFGLNSHDATNAFASTEWKVLTDTLPEIFLQADLHFAERRFKWATIEIPSDEGSVLLRPGCGQMMGDPMAVKGFVHAYGKVVMGWNRSHHGMFPGA